LKSSQIIEETFRRDHIIVIAGLVFITVLAWIYIVRFAATMTGVGEMSMPMMQAWTNQDFFINFLMWAVMMVGMMTPSASPMILLFARVNRQRQSDATPLPTTLVFLLGYLIVWSLFSLGATLIQWGLHSAALLSPEMIRVTPKLGGIFLIAAGIYQFTPLKFACLANCRTPLSFLMTEWQDGTRGALIMGLQHGIYCIGCCWLLMALLFVAGVMNLLWVALIAGYVLAEKVLPAGQWISRVMGIFAVGWGIWLLIRG